VTIGSFDRRPNVDGLAPAADSVEFASLCEGSRLLIVDSLEMQMERSSGLILPYGIGNDVHHAGAVPGLDYLRGVRTRDEIAAAWRALYDHGIDRWFPEGRDRLGVDRWIVPGARPWNRLGPTNSHGRIEAARQRRGSRTEVERLGHRHAVARGFPECGLDGSR